LLESQEKESKFSFHPRHVPVLAHWLDSHAVVDPLYPENDVVSIYFDTMRMEGLDGKANSDYAKSKFRIRWYRDPVTEAYGAVFAETKRKRGSTRSKDRIPLDLDPAELDRMWLGDPALAEIPRGLVSPERDIPADLLPIIQISYRRRRYVHRLSGTRLNLDWDIRPVKVNPHFSSFVDTTPLPVAVFEVKGPDQRIPAPLTQLMSANGRRDAYSKYYECCLSALREDRR